jgi:hypothetical protein
MMVTSHDSTNHPRNRSVDSHVEPFSAAFVVANMTASIARFALLLAGFALGCGSAPGTSTSDTQPSVDVTTAPSYANLFAMYFGPGTPGQCATAGCHADPEHTVWRCGPTKDDCYAGMLQIGLIDSTNPARSAIVDAHRSPLTWINPAGGNMPLDAQGPDATAGEALRAWVAAGAHND